MAKGNRRSRPLTGRTGFAVEHLHVSATCRPCADRGRPVVIRSRYSINPRAVPPGLPIGPPACPACGNRRFWAVSHGLRPDWADLYQRATRGEDVSMWRVTTEEQLRAQVLEELPEDDVHPATEEGTQDGTTEGSEGQQ